MFARVMGYAARARHRRQLPPFVAGTICYLCAKPIATSADADRDHVPARSYFPKSLRSQFNPELDTLWVHRACNRLIADDELYFLASIGPCAMGDVVGDALGDDLRRAYQADGRRRRLGEMAVREFGTVTTADGLVMKSYDHARCARVLWKITRGLAHLETGLVIPPDTPHLVRLYPTREEIEGQLFPNSWFTEIVATEPLGRYGRVLDYRVLGFIDRGDDGVEQGSTQVWALLLWDRVIAGVFFHNPFCSCDKCQEPR